MSVDNQIKKYSCKQKIWRYMSLDKLIYLLNYKKLFLCRADKFEDPLEGSYPKDYKDEIRKEYPDILDEKIAELVEVNKKLREYHYVNCWCSRDAELVALWKLYASKDIAIQTSIEILEKSLINHRDFLIYLCEVEYIDHTSESFYFANTLEPFKRKDYGYDYEHEIRIIRAFMHYSTNQEYLSDPNGFIQEKGITLDIDVNALIENIYISPYTDGKRIKFILDTLSEYDKNNSTNFKDRIRHSKINRTPIF